MGVRRLFSREGSKFFRGGKKHTVCLKIPKNILFSFKKSKNILFWPAKGGKRPSCPPLWTPMGPRGGQSLSEHQNCGRCWQVVGHSSEAPLNQRAACEPPDMLVRLSLWSKFIMPEVTVFVVFQRCPIHSPRATCGEWPFKCDQRLRSQVFRNCYDLDKMKVSRMHRMAI